jgi:signal transduction histidine kinase
MLRRLFFFEWSRDSLSRLERIFLGTSRTVAAPGTTSRPELESDEFPQELLASGIRIASPLHTDDGLLGIILIGNKVLERRFVEEDLKLLESARDHAVVALERVILVQWVAEEANEQRRLKELERIKSDFFSRVAHDLRTPLTSIHWTIQNLLDGVVGAPAQKRVVEPGPAVDHFVVPVRLISRQNGEIRRAHTGDDVGLPRLEPHRLRVFARDEEKHDPVEIGQRLPLAVHLPIKRVALENDPLARHVLLEAKRS